MIKWVTAWFLVVNITQPSGKQMTYTIPFESKEACQKELKLRQKNQMRGELALSAASIRMKSDIELESKKFICDKGQLPVYPR